MVTPDGTSLLFPAKLIQTIVINTKTFEYQWNSEVNWKDENGEWWKKGNADDPMKWKSNALYIIV